MLTPKEIHELVFKTTFRGFDQNEVTEFVTEVASELQQLIDENEYLKQMSQKQEERLNEFEEKSDALNNALLSTQKIIDQMKLEAEEKSKEIILSAKDEAKKIVHREQLEIDRLKKQQSLLREENKQFMQRIRYILKEHETLLQKFEKENIKASGTK